MEDSNKLIPIAQNNLVKKVNTSISITNKLLTENNERYIQVRAKRIARQYKFISENRELVKEIFEKNDSCLLLALLTEYYPLTINNIENLTEFLDWQKLSGNNVLNWSSQLLKQFEKNWDWCSISGNNSLPWSENLIVQFYNKWNWQYLTYIKNLPWSEEFINKFEDFCEIS